jgi:tRNA dimethylallyltransferase
VQPDFLAIVGPTASGKTALSLEVARGLDGEIISTDSRQVYRGMDVGTAKVGEADRGAVPHHGLDLVDPDVSYSAGRFAREARGWIREIRGRDRVPVLVGGTGFFLRALTDPIFREPALDRVRQSALRQWISRQSSATLAAWVKRLDPERSEVAAEGGPQRLGRTLEIALLTGRPLSWWHRAAGPDDQPLEGLIVLLALSRDELDRRIEARVDHMLESGLVEEVRALLAAGYTPADPGMTGTGYREVVKYLVGDGSLEETREAICRATRQYARRQLTWFRNQLPPETLTLDATAPLHEQITRVVSAWRAVAPETVTRAQRSVQDGG